MPGLRPTEEFSCGTAKLLSWTGERMQVGVRMLSSGCVMNTEKQKFKTPGEG